jgi:murein L,D-transpeptidase YcbB/YkuD
MRNCASTALCAVDQAGAIVSAARASVAVTAFALAAVFTVPVFAETAPAEASTSAQPGAIDGVSGGVRALLAAGESQPLDDLYRTRGYQPLWIEAGAPTEEAAAALRLLQSADQDGLHASAYHPEVLAADLVAARQGQPQALARFEIELTRALGDYAADLRTTRADGAPVFTDPDLQPPTDARAAAWRAAATAPVGKRVAAISRMNPLYMSLKAAYVAAAPGSGAAKLALANMERLRAVPADLGPRFLLVDLAAQRLWMYEAGRPPQTMKVVVGRRSEATPAMVGLLRSAVFRPSWDVPADLAQARAHKVLVSGTSFLAAQDIEALSDASEHARPVPLDKVDWRAAADGGQAVHLRQRPGPKNMMGQVKFAFANTYGVVLHDTPLRWVFDQPQRTASAGCVRLEDAPRLARWLLGPETANAALAADGPPDNEVAFAQPVPVYILYLTDAPADGPLGAGPLKPRPDVYHQDGPAPHPAKGTASVNSGRHVG